MSQQSLHSLHSKGISAKKTKLMTKNTSGINKEIKVNGQKLEKATSFKCLGSIITDEGSKPEILCRIAQTTAALQEHFSQFQDTTDALPCIVHLPVCM